MVGYQLKITLEYTKPPVWRRVIVPDRITFSDLHNIIQVLFGWEDMHLHDFSFPEDMQLHIGPIEEESYYSNDLDEEYICIDDYIKNHKWIRYTYDFGDDWRHKIVLEQEISDYNKRYPQVIKYKGDNFIEDSGGFFDEEETVRDVFDMQAVNSWMEANLILKRTRRDNKGQGTIDKRGRQGRKPEDFMAAMNEIVTQKNLEFDENTLAIWNETINEFQALMETMSSADMGRKSLMERKMEQLDWYFHEEGEFSSISIKSNIKKAASKRSHKEVLLDLQKDELKELATALRIYFAKSWNKEKLATEIAAKIQAHPEYLYYFLNKKEFPELLKFAQAPEGTYRGKLPSYVLRTMLWWGYMDVDFWTGTETVVTISMPTEIEEIVKTLETTDWRKECNNIEKIASEMVRLLLYYGCVELEKFYELCNQVLHTMEQEEFYNYIYFTIDGRDHIWVIEEDHIRYICFGDFDIDFIMNCRKEQVQDLDYCSLTLLDVERWKKGVGVVYPEWKEFAQILCKDYDIPGDSVNELIEFELYPAVIEGSNLTELIHMVENLINIEHIEDYVQIWEILQDIFLHTRIAGLKGYTREQLAKLKGVNPFTIAASKEEQRKRKVKTEDHMYETPVEYQRQISEIIKEEKEDPKLAAEKLEQVLKKYNKDHYESRFLLARIYYKGNQLENARIIMESLAEETDSDKLKKRFIQWEKENMTHFSNGISKQENKSESGHISQYSSRGRKKKTDRKE